MLCWKKHSSEEQTEQNNKTNVPLQVRSPFYVRKRSMLRKAECGPVSRAFPSSPGNRENLKIRGK